MERDLDTFSIEIPINDEQGMKDFQEIMDSLAEETNQYIINLSKELNISMRCASDVWYLRTRSRWSEENEKELIRLHSVGTPPNVFDWP